MGTALVMVLVEDQDLVNPKVKDTTVVQVAMVEEVTWVPVPVPGMVHDMFLDKD